MGGKEIENLRGNLRGNNEVRIGGRATIEVTLIGAKKKYIAFVFDIGREALIF